MPFQVHPPATLDVVLLGFVSKLYLGHLNSYCGGGLLYKVALIVFSGLQAPTVTLVTPLDTMEQVCAAMHSSVLCCDEFLARGRVVNLELPCGMTLGSYKHYSHRHCPVPEWDLEITLLKEGDELIMVFEFMAEL